MGTRCRVHKISIRGAIGGLDFNLRVFHFGRIGEFWQQRGQAGADRQRTKLPPRHLTRAQLIFDDVIDRVVVAHVVTL